MSHLLFILLQAQTPVLTADNPLTSIAQSLGIVGILGALAWYYMVMNQKQQKRYEEADARKQEKFDKDLKDMRDETDRVRKVYEDRIDKLIEKQGGMSERLLNTVNENTQSVRQLSAIIDEIKRNSKS